MGALFYIQTLNPWRVLFEVSGVASMARMRGPFVLHTQEALGAQSKEVMLPLLMSSNSCNFLHIPPSIPQHGWQREFRTFQSDPIVSLITVLKLKVGFLQTKEKQPHWVDFSAWACTARPQSTFPASPPIPGVTSNPSTTHRLSALLSGDFFFLIDGKFCFTC